MVLAVAIVFILLGMWQLDRLQERRTENQLGESRFTETPATMTHVAELPAESLEYRQVIATGTFDTDAEVLVRSQVHFGNAGFHVITPLVGEAGEAVLVNRGWVPLGFETLPVAETAPPSGIVAIEGWIHLTQERPPLGPEDPAEGSLTQMNRVDVQRISRQVPYELAVVYVVELGEQGSGLPIPVAAPVFDDEGPHLAYAIQWFGFAVVLLVGWVFFVRQQVRRPTQSRSGTPAKPSITS